MTTAKKIKYQREIDRPILDGAAMALGVKQNRRIETAYKFLCKDSIEQEVREFLSNEERKVFGLYDKWTKQDEGLDYINLVRFDMSTKSIKHICVMRFNSHYESSKEYYREDDEIHVFDLSSFINYQLGVEMPKCFDVEFIEV